MTMGPQTANAAGGKERRLNIVMPLSFFPKGADDRVPRFVEDQVQAFLKSDPTLRVTVLVPHHESTRAEEQRDGYRIIRFHYFWPRRFEKLAGAGIMPAIEENRCLALLIPFLFVCELNALWRLARKEPVDYMYAHWFTPQGLVAAIVSRLTGIPFGFTSHSSDVAVWGRVPLIGRWVVRRFVPWASSVSVVSRRSLEKLKAFFDESEWSALAPRVAVIPMGVDVHKYGASEWQKHEPKARLGLKGKTVLFFIGRLVEKKGVGFLLDAFANLVRDESALHLVIAGDGPLRAVLEQQAESLGVSEKVEFLGFVQGRRKTEYLRLADMLIVPSVVTASGDAEGLPVSLMEGMACGTTCIATRASGADDVVTDGVDGILIADRSSESIVDAVKRVLAMPTPERERLEQNARHLAETLDWSVIAERHMKHFFDGMKA